MTSDAKIGLLLGLVFIFVIAFILNGLPNFLRDTNTNELTNSMVSFQSDSSGIGSRERRISREVMKQEIRFSVPMPKEGVFIVEERDGVVEINPMVEAEPLFEVEQKQISGVKIERSVWPKKYVAGEGDNLTIIAKKFYGAEHGSKLSSVIGIFEANRNVLESADDVCVGQRLVIPSLSVSSGGKNKIDSLSAITLFEKVDSIGKRNSFEAGSEVKPAGQYIVKDGDSLWRIAAEQLGDGSRYAEIAKLNAGVLDDENALAVGMSLNLPLR